MSHLGQVSRSQMAHLGQVSRSQMAHLGQVSRSQMAHLGQVSRSSERLVASIGSDEGPSINYVRILTYYLDPLPHFLHVIRNGNHVWEA